MSHQTDTAFEPGKARVENQIYKADQRRERDAALASIYELLRIRHRRVLIDRRGGVRSAIFFPIAVVGVVITMMLRPYILRHARDHAQEKTECAIESLGAKQAAM